MKQQQRSPSSAKLVLVLDFDNTLVLGCGGIPISRIEEVLQDFIKKGQQYTRDQIISLVIITPENLKALIDSFIRVVMVHGAVLYLNTRGILKQIEDLFNKELRINGVLVNAYIQQQTNNQFMSIFPPSNGDVSTSLFKGLYGSYPNDDFMIPPILYRNVRKDVVRKQGQQQQAYLDRLEARLEDETESHFEKKATKEDRAKIDAGWTKEKSHSYKEKVVWAWQKMLNILSILTTHLGIPLYFFDDDKTNIDIAETYLKTSFGNFHAIHLPLEPHPPLPFLQKLTEILGSSFLPQKQRSQGGGGGGGGVRRGEEDLSDQDRVKCPKLSELWLTFYDELQSNQDIPLSKEDALVSRKELPHFSGTEMIYLWRDEKTRQNFLTMRTYHHDFDQEVEHIKELFKETRNQRWTFFLYNEKSHRVEKIGLGKDREAITQYYTNLEIMRNILSRLSSQQFQQMRGDVRKILALEIPAQVRHNFETYKKDLHKMIA